MLLDGVEAQRLDILDGLGESVGGHIVGRSCLKLKGQALEGGTLPRHLVDHLATTLIGRQLFEPLLLAIEHANARRSVHLMSAESEEVAIHGLNVDLEVGCALGSIHQNGDAMGVGYLDDLFNGIDGAQNVAHMGHTDNLGLIGDERFELIQTQDTIIGNGKMLHDDASFHGLELPRDDVGVVLHLCDNHLVAGLHLRFAERAGYQVDSLRGATCKDDLLDLTGVDKRAHLFTCRLVQIGSLLTQVVDTTMHVGIHIEILVAHGIEHHEWLLRSGRIVEIDQRFLIHLARQNREIFSYLIEIVHKSYLQSLQPSHLLSSPRKRFSTR